jgi:hypothetical protein
VFLGLLKNLPSITAIVAPMMLGSNHIITNQNKERLTIFSGDTLKIEKRLIIAISLVPKP